jgi:hypothetical protein
MSNDSARYFSSKVFSEQYDCKNALPKSAAELFHSSTSSPEYLLDCSDPLSLMWPLPLSGAATLESKSR